MQTPETPQLTPIEKAIEFYKNLPNPNPIVLEEIEKLLPYESQYLRDVAEKAFEAGENRGMNNYYDKQTFPGEAHPNKQTYLNQNHPL